MKNPIFTRTVIAASVIVLLLFFMTAYQVRQDENVILTRFGQPVRVIQQAGLYFKWPWPIEAVNRFDAPSARSLHAYGRRQHRPRAFFRPLSGG
jgi:regulator of protease activity HflC (stomatin/prohibitin superfamily)